MTWFFVALLIVAAASVWWVVHRSARLRREAASREARVLEALFAARQSADGGATIDVDRIFGGPPAAAPASADAVLRAAGLHPEVIDLLTRSQAGASAGEPATPKAASPAAAVNRLVADPTATAEVVAPQEVRAAEPEAPVPVRDLVQVLYEGRGFRAAPVDPAALPIELVLVHRSDAQRSYAFVPLAGALSETVVQSIIARARRIDQLRVLIANEVSVPSELVDALLPRGVRVFDRVAIEAQLARLDADLAEKIRAAARRRAVRRQQAN